MLGLKFGKCTDYCAEHTKTAGWRCPCLLIGNTLFADFWLRMKCELSYIRDKHTRGKGLIFTGERNAADVWAVWSVSSNGFCFVPLGSVLLFSSASHSSLNVGNAPETWNVLGLSIKRPHQQLRTERERVCVSLFSSGLAVLWCAPLHIRNFEHDKAERYSSSLRDFSFGALIHIVEFLIFMTHTWR